MAERRDESGGVEIGMCLKKTEMDNVMAFSTMLKYVFRKPILIR